MVVRTADPVEHIFKIELHIYDDRKDHFDTITLPDPVLTECHQEAFCVLYTFRIKDETYREAVRKLDVQYSHYVMCKLEQDDATLAEDYTGYPAQKDEQITTDFVALRDRWYEELELTHESGYDLAMDSKKQRADERICLHDRWHMLRQYEKI